MSSNGIYACDSSYVNRRYYDMPYSMSYVPYRGTEGYSYSDEALMHLHLAATRPASLWDAKFATINSNINTMYKATPYSYVRTFNGGRTYYSVLDPADYSSFNCYSQPREDLNKRISDMASASSINIYAQQIGVKLSNINGMAGWTTHKYLSEESKAQAQAVVDTCKVYSEKLNKYLKNEDKLSADSVNTILSALKEQVTAFDEEVKALDEQLREEAKEAEAAKAEEVASSVGDGSSGDGAGASAGAGASSVSVVGGDSQMNNGQLANRYNVKAPVTGEIGSSYVSNVITSAGDRGTFTTNLAVLNNQNIVSFLTQLSDAQIDSLISDIDGQSYCSDDDELSIRELLAKFDGALETLKAAGYLTDDEYNRACQYLMDAKSQVKDSFTDSQEAKVKSDLKSLKALLSVQLSDGTTVTKGSQKHFDGLIKQKQAEAVTSAAVDFRKAYAKSTENSETPVTYDESISYGDLPEEITYLPNKKVFQVKLEGKTFQGKDFAEINSKIMKCKDEATILSWVDLKKELLTVSAGAVAATSGETPQAIVSEIDPFSPSV